MSIEQYLKHISWIIALSIFLIGCQTVQENICTFPDAPNQAAPEWICNPTSLVIGNKFTTLGIGTSPAPTLKIVQCMGHARMEMAKQLQISVTNMIQRITTGDDDQETVHVITTQVSNAILHNTNLVKQITSQNGTLYCLMTIDDDKYSAIRKAANKVSSNSEGTEKALWLKFKTKMSIDEMVKQLESEDLKRQDTVVQ